MANRKKKAVPAQETRQEKAKRIAREKARQQAREKARENARQQARDKARQQAREKAREEAREKARENARQQARDKARQQARDKAREEAEEDVAQQGRAPRPPSGGNVKNTFDAAETILGTLTLSAVYGGIVSMMCYLGWMTVGSLVGNLVGQFMYDVGVGFTTGLITKVGLSAGLGPILAIGIPALIFSYHLIYAIANGQTGFSIKNDIPSLISGVSYALPYISFALCLGVGISMTSALWVAFGLGTASGIFMSELGQSIFQPIISNLTNNNPSPPHDDADEETPEPDLTSKPAAKSSKTITHSFDAAKGRQKTLRQQTQDNNGTKPKTTAKQNNSSETEQRKQPTRKTKPK
ncbi:MAG: hypothetical protein BGO43_10285 [Gammaproteobacteria bacterium 39-13]|nr:hypothetical protein [Gammaproteobacteria bacterium]OJV90312.1 MAG: hypothetical protein BGO43_10285 [Gammaproteobacteria bacterium 39-13]